MILDPYLGGYMNIYDIRNQIKRENKLKLIGDFGMILFLLVILCCIIFACKLNNPFYVLKAKEGTDLEREFKKGTDYVTINNATLEFTGYFKEDKQGKILYNCYATVIGSNRFFVFIPPERSGSNASNPDESITGYSFTARMHKDNNLIKMVAADYNMTVEEWNQTNKISQVVMDEVNTQRVRMFVVWSALICIVIICILYGLITYRNLRDIYIRREVEYLKKYGDIDDVLDDINEEVENDIEFDSIHIKITKNYFLCFLNGKLLIDKKSALSDVKVVSRVKKVYGIVKLGYERYLQVMREGQLVIELPIENAMEEEEILSLMHKK